MHRDQRGFTLVEVIIVSAAIVLVLAGIYSFFSFGQRLFDSGAGQADLHGLVRAAAERVIRELRFAGEVELLEENWDPASASTDEYSYIYYDSPNRTLMLLHSAASQAISAPVVTGVNFSAEGQILLFTIKGEEGSTVFTLDSSVKPMNLSRDIDISNTGDSGNSQALRFALHSGP